MVKLRQKGPWTVPAVVLILLIVASVTRWQTVASKSRDWEVLKWQRDRWTGTVILITYSLRSVYVDHLGPYKEVSEALTAIWQLAVVIVLAWLGWSLFRSLRPRRPSANR